MNKHAEKAPLGTLWTKNTTNEVWQKMENEWHFVGIFDPKTVDTFEPLEECSDKCLPYINDKLKKIIKAAAKLPNFSDEDVGRILKEIATRIEKEKNEVD